MIETGTYNYLIVKNNLQDKLILIDRLQQETVVLLTDTQGTGNIRIGDEILVFVCHNEAGNLAATTERPFACVGDFVLLKVISENEFGSFMDLGLDTPLFVPVINQEYPFEVNHEYVVYVHLDKNGKLTASSWLDDHIDTELKVLDEGEEVSLLICDISDDRYYAIINNRYMGILYRHEVYENVEVGDSMKAYIRKIKPENNKIELCLRPPGFEFIVGSKDVILDILKENDGILNLGDKSAPEEIHRQLKMSKKAFKQVIGGLYKERLITISDHQIRLA